MKKIILETIVEIRPDIDPLSQNLIETLDSLDITTLIASLEKKLHIRIPIGEIMPENFKDINAILSLIDRIK